MAGADHETVELKVAVVEDSVIVEQTCEPLVSSRALLPSAFLLAHTRTLMCPAWLDDVVHRIPKASVHVPAVMLAVYGNAVTKESPAVVAVAPVPLVGPVALEIWSEADAVVAVALAPRNAFQNGVPVEIFATFQP